MKRGKGEKDAGEGREPGSGNIKDPALNESHANLSVTHRLA